MLNCINCVGHYKQTVCLNYTLQVINKGNTCSFITDETILKNFFGFKNDYFSTIKFIRQRKPIVKFLGLGSCFDFLELGFELGTLEKPY